MLKFAIVCTLITLLACGRAESPDPAKPATAAGPTEAESPAANGFAPFLSATRDGLLLSWLEPVAGTDRTAVRYARYRNGSWSKPQTIVERNDLFANWADFPSIVEDEHGTLFVHWLQKSGAGTYAYDVRMSASVDGKAWSEPFLLNRDGTQTEHGFVSLAPVPGGGVGATWLDGRKMNPDAGHEHDAGNMTIRYATVDRTGAIASETELDSRVCECCTTGMTMVAAGPVIAYRDRSVDEVRDISYVRKHPSGWSEPEAVNRDGWQINACPVNGPQLDAIGSVVVASWFTAANEQQRVYVAFSSDGGISFGPPLRVDDGKPAGRVDTVMLDDASALAVWLEQTPAGAEIRARRVRRDGTADESMKVADSSTARGAGFPRIARVGDEVWFAWTDQTARSKRIRLARGWF